MALAIQVVPPTRKPWLLLLQCCCFHIFVEWFPWFLLYPFLLVTAIASKQPNLCHDRCLVVLQLLGDRTLGRSQAGP